MLGAVLERPLTDVADLADLLGLLPGVRLEL